MASKMVCESSACHSSHAGKPVFEAVQGLLCQSSLHLHQPAVMVGRLLAPQNKPQSKEEAVGVIAPGVIAGGESGGAAQTRWLVVMAV